MRIGKLMSVALVCLALSACASVLIGNKAQSLMMKALFKPLVGFDPTEVKILENPLIKNRMQALLGDKYEPTMKLLNTAQEIQREGALFYIASRYAPAKVQAITDKAGLIWNSDTNQMAVMLIQNGKAEILSEQIEGAKEKLLPSLPTELQIAYDKAKAAEEAVTNAKNNLIDSSVQTLGNHVGVDQQTQDLLESVVKGESVAEIARKKAQASAEQSLDHAQDQAAEQVDGRVPSPIKKTQDAADTIDDEIAKQLHDESAEAKP